MAAAPELTRFNDLLADLADRLKPALVHVRVRRGGSGAKDDDAPGEPGRLTTTFAGLALVLNQPERTSLAWVGIPLVAGGAAILVGIVWPAGTRKSSAAKLSNASKAVSKSCEVTPPGVGAGLFIWS